MRRLLLLGHTDGATATAGGLGVLTAHTQAPVMTHTTVGTDLLQTLQILTQLGVQVGRRQLRVLAIDDVLLPVEEPGGDLVLARVQDDGHQFLDLHNNNETPTVSTKRSITHGHFAGGGIAKAR